MTSSVLRHASLASTLLGAIALFGPTASQAQWSADAADNLIVADEYADQTQPKIVATADGGYYLSWFDDIDHGFGIHLQRLDAQGNEQWAHNGVLVAERNLGFTYDYGLAVDADGNAYIAFNCCENNSDAEHIAISKIAPDGSLSWGAAGLTVSAPASTERPYTAHVTTTSDDHVVVAWSSDAGARVQKLDTDGAAQWAQDGLLLTPASGFMLLADLQPSQDGDVIVSWSNQAGPTRILRAQKLASADGAILWGAGGVRVFGQGNLQAGYFPSFIADASGGGVFSDYDAVGVRFNARVQHLDASGAPLFDPNGVLATTDTLNDHVGTAATFDPASGDIYVIWQDERTENMQSYSGVSAQRIDSSGQRQWGDAGKVLAEPVVSTDGTHSISQLTALTVPGGFLGGWTTGAIPAADQPITVARVTADGSYAWDAQNVAVKTLRYTGRTVGAIGADGSAVYAWQDGEEGAATIRAQNLNPDGTLGNAVSDRIFVDGFDGT